jgi:hypothetical protein
MKPLIWKARESWYPLITAWLNERMPQGAIHRLETRGELEYFWDDPEWLSVFADALDCGVEALTAEMAEQMAPLTLRAYHGCRVEDAGIYASDGLKLNDPADMDAFVRRIVGEEDTLAWMRPQLEQRLASFDHRERDRARLYVCLDDRALIDSACHYLIYGSEWVMAFLGFEGHEVLRSRGVPTVLEIDLPLAQVSSRQRRDLASDFLQEWTHTTVNKTGTVPLRDFTFCLRAPIAPQHIVGHRHPDDLVDVHHHYIRRRSPSTHCPSCLETTPATPNSQGFCERDAEAPEHE